jgi:hypothetical protein
MNFRSFALITRAVENPITRPGTRALRAARRLLLIFTAVVLAWTETVSPRNASAKTETRIISLSGHIDFGPLEIGMESGRLLSITNRGNSPLTISNITLPDGFSVIFPFGSDTNSPLATLDPGAWTNVFILFSPTNVAKYGGTGTVDSDATRGAGEFTVSGEGAYPTGNFVGLFYPFWNPTIDNSGYFSAKAAKGGAISGVLRMAGQRYPFSGRFSPAGTFSCSVPREGTNNVYISFQAFPGSWWGSVSNNTWVADLSAYRTPVVAGRFGRLRSAFIPGKYRMSISGSEDPLLAPTNNGTGTIKVTTSDVVHLSGTLADGTKFSQATFRCGTQVPFYTSLYGGQGAVLGWIYCEVVPTNFPPIIIPPVILPPTNPVPVTNFPPITNLPPVIIQPTLSSMPALSTTPSLNSLLRIHRYRHPGAGFPSSPETFGTNRISGSINWFKPPQIDTNYPDGFSLMMQVTGPVP